MKILVIGNNSISQTNSNGRTIKNLLDSFKPNEIKQFCLSINNPDYDSCSQFCVVSDGDAVRSFLGRPKKISLYEMNDDISNKNHKHRTHKRTPMKMLIREHIWRVTILKNKALLNWVKENAFDFILLQAGDSGFMYHLSVYLSQTYGIPLIIYNSEDYPFKEYNYLVPGKKRTLLYNMFHKLLNEECKKAYSQSSLNVFLNDDLKDLYCSAYGIKGITIFNSANGLLERINDEPHNQEVKTIRYFGNIGNKRIDSLIDVGNVIEKLSLPFVLEIYADADAATASALNKIPSIRFKGFVGYEEVLIKSTETDFNLHVESFDPFYEVDVSRGFSTKIPDLLAACKPLIIYCPASLFVYRYLHDNNAAYCADSIDSLEQLLVTIASSGRDDLCEIVSSAKRLQKLNHDPHKNGALFRREVEELKNA